jgi:Histidine kinase
MTINDLIFSNRSRERLSRHMLFLVGYSWLFHFQNDNRTLLYAASFLPACIVTVYGFIYLLLPFLKKKKYGRFALGLSGLYLVTVVLGVLGSYLFFTDWDGPVTTRMIIGLALHNHVIAFFMGGVALSIKVTKNWYVRQIENLELQKQKAKHEFRLEKANLYPEFILQALNSLQGTIATGSDESPALLLKLSDTLSYILYDGQDDLIELEKELTMVRNIIDFNKLNWGRCASMHISTFGDPENKSIAPLTLFRLTQNLLQFIGRETNGLNEVDIKIQVEYESLTFKLIAIYSLEKSSMEDWKSTVNKLQTQLDGVYHGACELKAADDEYAYSISLRLGLIQFQNRTLNMGRDTQDREYVLA